MRCSRGFTLIELILALVVLAFISLGIGSFLRLGADGYISTVDRERLQSEARFVVERISREIRHAAPNSVDVAGNCLQFYPVYLSAFYFDHPELTDTEIEFVPREGDVALWAGRDTNGDSVLKEEGVAIGFVDARQYRDALKPVIEDVTVANGIGTMAYRNTFTAQSPAKRLYVYGSRVAFCVAGTELTRQVDGEAAVVISKRVSQFSLSVITAGLNQNSVVHMALEFTDERSRETSNYNHSVQVINVL